MNVFKTPAFASHVKELMRLYRVPGLAIAVTKDGETSSAGYGMASLQPPVPCTPDTLFEIASSCKSMTAASVALLVDDDQVPEVHGDALMSELLPEDFVLSDESYTKGTTIDDLLGHRTGVLTHLRSFMSSRAEQPDTARSVTRNLRNLAVGPPIRSKYIYCDMMYTVLTYLVERKSGIPFADFLQQRFFTPLGMKSTQLQPRRIVALGEGHRLAKGHSWDRSTCAMREFDNPDRPEGQGAGAMTSSANDYIRWVQAMLDEATPVNQNIITFLTKPRSFAETTLVKDWLGPFTSPTVAGAGLETFYYRGHLVIGHYGMAQGFASRHFYIPDAKFGVVIFANSMTGAQLIEVLSRELTDDALEVAPSQRPNWKETIAPKVPEDADVSTESSINAQREVVRCRLCPDGRDAEPQTLSLDAYTGDYYNEGYHKLKVQALQGKLFIDATDRSFGFTLSFEHLADQTKYVAYQGDFLEGGGWPIGAEFELESGRAVKLGLHLEDKLEDLIWFTRL